MNVVTKIHERGKREEKKEPLRKNNERSPSLPPYLQFRADAEKRKKKREIPGRRSGADVVACFPLSFLPPRVSREEEKKGKRKGDSFEPARGNRRLVPLPPFGSQAELDQKKRKRKKRKEAWEGHFLSFASATEKEKRKKETHRHRKSAAHRLFSTPLFEPRKEKKKRRESSPAKEGGNKDPPAPALHLSSMLSARRSRRRISGGGKRKGGGEHHNGKSRQHPYFIIPSAFFGGGT